MVNIENVPLFKTKAPVTVGNDAIEQTQPAHRPLLPVAEWVTGIASFTEARQVQRSLSGQWATACGRGVDGYYVAAPNSGLTSVSGETEANSHR